LVDLLDRIPVDSSSLAAVYINDYVGIREEFGIELPASDASPEDIRTYRDEVAMFRGTEPAYLRFNGLYLNPVEKALKTDLARQETGITALDIDRDAWTSTSIVLQGRFDVEAVEKAVASDVRLAKFLSRKEFRGFKYFSWPGAIAQTPLAGRDMGLAVTPDYVYITNRGSERMIDFPITLEGAGPSLADFAPFRELAVAMQASRALGIHLSTDRYSEQNYGDLWRGAYGDAAVDELRGQSLLVPYIAFAVGWGMKGEIPQVFVATYQSTPGEASENAERLRRRVDEGYSFFEERPWREIFTVDDIHIDGTLVFARLNVARADVRIWSDMVHNLDSLWAVESR
jgi:hypothetical protein